MLKMGKIGVVKNIFEGMSAMGSTEEYIEELIKIIKEKSAKGTPDGTSYCNNLQR